MNSVHAGVEATNYIESKEFYTDRSRFPLPELILLDLKMPRVDGLEFLMWLRQHPQGRDIPVVVLANSTFDPDIQKAYALGANSFLLKPHELNVFADALKQVVNAWTNRSHMPRTAPFSPSPEAGRTELHL